MTELEVQSQNVKSGANCYVVLAGKSAETFN